MFQRNYGLEIKMWHDDDDFLSWLKKEYISYGEKDEDIIEVMFMAWNAGQENIKNILRQSAIQIDNDMRKGELSGFLKNYL